ncbi:Rv3654c family TadE-like protein [Kocuria sp. CH-021]|uniref:Rv3654c family TadE-like protein n=1 Tax=Kocuria sp. CH-021 TaxID=3406735 RepID=UPI003C787CBD
MSESPVPRGPQGRRRGRDRDGDLGSGTVHALTLALVLGVLLLTVLLLAQAGIATHRAGKAADLAALAAADTARGLVAGDPCGTAERVARENGARLEQCKLEEPGRVVVDVRTTVALDGPLARIGSARGVSRAGPPEATGPP